MTLRDEVESVLLKHGGYQKHSEFVWACKCGWTGNEWWRSHIEHLARMLVSEPDPVLVICICGADLGSLECRSRGHLRGPRARADQ